MKQDKQPRRASKKDATVSQLHPRSDMNTRAKGGDKESNEPLRARLGSSDSPQNGPAKRNKR
jgi:hypothetical protein